MARDSHGVVGERWIGFDLDGTLAMYDGWKGIEHIGDPIPEMRDLICRLHGEGKRVKIFTARVAPRTITAKDNSIPGFGMTGERSQGEAFVWKCKSGKVGMDPLDFYKKYAHEFIEEWCERHLYFKPEVTCVKDQLMEMLYDDRCVQVIENKGKIVGEVLFKKMKDFASSVAILEKYIGEKQCLMSNDTYEELKAMAEKASEVLARWNYEDILE